MPQWTITLSHTSVGSLTVKRFVGGFAGYKRNPPGRPLQLGVTPWRNPIIVGDGSEYYQWAIAADFTESENQLFDALVGFQAGRYSAFLNGALTLVDQFELLAPETGTYSRTLFSSQTSSVGAAWTTGYGQFNVLAVLPDGTFEPAGYGAIARTNFKRRQFGLIELRA